MTGMMPLYRRQRDPQKHDRKIRRLMKRVTLLDLVEVCHRLGVRVRFERGGAKR